MMISGIVVKTRGNEYDGYKEVHLGRLDPSVDPRYEKQVS